MLFFKQNDISFEANNFSSIVDQSAYFSCVEDDDFVDEDEEDEEEFSEDSMTLTHPLLGGSTRYSGFHEKLLHGDERNDDSIQEEEEEAEEAEAMEGKVPSSYSHRHRPRGALHSPAAGDRHLALTVGGGGGGGGATAIAHMNAAAAAAEQSHHTTSPNASMMWEEEEEEDDSFNEESEPDEGNSFQKNNTDIEYGLGNSGLISPLNSAAAGIARHGTPHVHPRYVSVHPDSSPKNKHSDISSMSGRNPEDNNRPTCCSSFRGQLVSFWRLNRTHPLILLAVPLLLVSRARNWGPGPDLAFSVICLIPFASSIGILTELLAEKSHPVAGAILNASFGNAAELFISLFALKENMLLIVQISLLGSILSNLLLVMGSALLLGGFKYHRQTFCPHTTAVNNGVLLLSVIAILFPAAMRATAMNDQSSELSLSRFTSLILLSTYVAVMVFHLCTHSKMASGISVAVAQGSPVGQPTPAGRAARLDAHQRSSSAPSHDLNGLLMHVDDNEYAHLSEQYSTLFLTASLFVISAATGVLSQLLVSNIEGTVSQWGLPKLFIGAIIVPIVGNAAEHLSAIHAAYHNKMTLAFGIAVQSSIQIALCVIPTLVLVAWAMHRPLTLNFHLFETATLFSSTLLVSILWSSGRSTWLTGLLLIVMYTLAAACFFLAKRRDGSSPSMNLSSF